MQNCSEMKGQFARDNLSGSLLSKAMLVYFVQTNIKTQQWMVFNTVQVIFVKDFITYING